MSKKYIIYDIGGTYIKWAIATSDYQIIEKNKFAFDCANRDCKTELMDAIGKQIVEFVNKYPDICGIGISTAGDVDTNTTEIIGSAPNHKNYAKTNIKEALSQYTQLPIAIDNDANCAILGEHTKGILQNTDNAILITLGTDIGGGILINGNVYRGFKGSAGEVGYMHVLDRRWGTWFSAAGLSRLVKQNQNIDNLDPVIILKNDLKQYSKEVAYWYKGLSIGIANLITLFNPQKLIIGGGLSESNLINLKVINYIKNKILIESHLIDSCEIILSKHGNASALYGCIKMLNDKLE
ncbi:ROK family-glucose kinase or transcriptional regulator [Malacoplasma penetrans HF-2]|uniref:ROK family-glucose kinase or transcriptional regulator n=1 Tax=Malacoplasma penetrans (strain HF-2) TaxID=272633 RepID=Q8EUF7_MALP2|nr:ROK family protein [Malacoplasma penetrans]BAC44756.1 ROK family-glucose kinase or transcriptional regulator [Malacoplasma penetrans HF-2]